MLAFFRKKFCVKRRKEMDLIFLRTLVVGIGLWISLASAGMGDAMTCVDQSNGRSLQYDPYYELCCGDKIYDNFHEEYGCFELTGVPTIYRWRDEFICADQILPILGEQQCCNDAVFNVTTTLCCEGNQLEKSTPSHECCGPEAIDTSTSTCCDGNRVDGLGDCCGPDRVYNTQRESCFEEAVYPVPERYGNRLCQGESNSLIYNDATHICCGGIVAEKNGEDCYNGVLYDPATHMITYQSTESDTIAIEDGRTKFCASRTYNPNEEVCCASQVYYVGTADGACCRNYDNNGVLPYSKHNSSCCMGVITPGVPEIPGIHECSGNRSFLSSGNISCSMGAIQQRPDGEEVACCGHDIFNVESSICCRGKVHSKTSLADECCGTEILQENQLCYEDSEVVTVKAGEDALCVHYNGSFMWDRITGYDSSLYVCSRGALAVKRPNYGFCEGPHRFYELSTELCCERYGIYPNSNTWGLKRECCGIGFYHPEEESCLHGRSYPFPEEYSGRCSTHLYDNRTHVCINGDVFSKETTSLTEEMCRRNNQLEAFNQRCCRRTVIDDSTHLCCNDYIHLKGDMEDPQCCGITAYDNASAEYKCCDERLHDTGGVPKDCDGHLAVARDEQVCGQTIHKKSAGECCGEGVFNNRTHLCCGGVRIEKNHIHDECCGTAKYRGKRDRRHKCCGGVTLHPKTPGMVCCGSSLINPSRETCLGDQFAISIGTGLTCNPNISYSEGTCCKGLMHFGKHGSCNSFEFSPSAPRAPRANDGQSPEDYDDDAEEAEEEEEDTLLPCGEKAYNARTHSCCNENVIKIGQKICCGGKARRVTDAQENDCCGNKAFNNHSSICCGKNIRDISDIRRGRCSTEGCCENGWHLDLTSMKCLEDDTQEDQECTLCRTAERDEIEAKVCQATYAVSVKITGSSGNVIKVKASSLFKKDSDYQDVLSRRDLKRLRQLVPPENCACLESVQKGKYVLLSSGQLEDCRLSLNSSDLLLPSKNKKTVTDLLESGICRPTVE